MWTDTTFYWWIVLARWNGYCEMLRQLIHTTQNEGWWMFTNGIGFNHDNVQLHTANVIRQFLQDLSWQLLPSLFAPGIVPWRSKLQQRLRAEEHITTCFTKMAANSYEEGSRKLVPRLDKYLPNSRSHV